MNRLIVSMCIIVLVLVQSNQRLVITMIWQMNRATISKTLCVNKDKPMLKCGGKCQLSKQFSAMEESQHSNDAVPVTLLMLEETNCIVEDFQPLACITELKQVTGFVTTDWLLPESSVSEILAPPPMAG